MILAFLIGILSAFVSSAPLGPTNFWVAKIAISKESKRLLPFSCGVILIDIIYACIAFWGFFYYLNDQGYNRIIGIIASAIIIIIGIIDLKGAKPLEAETKKNNSAIDPIKDFFSGIIFCATNPLFILYWVSVAGFLKQHVSILDPLVGLFFYIGIAIGDIIWYYGFYWLLQKGVTRLKSSWLLWLQRGIAITLIIFGTVGIYGFI